VTPQGKGEVWVTLPGKSIGNGIVFDRKGFMYIADYTEHNVLKIDPKSRKISVYAHNDQMNQPNDLAITIDGTLYASDPNWERRPVSSGASTWTAARRSSPRTWHDQRHRRQPRRQDALRQ